MFEGLQNLNWIRSSSGDSIEITTYTSDLSYMIDRQTTAIFAGPDLIEGSLGNLSLEKITGSVGADTEFNFEFSTLNEIPIGGNVRVIFEDDTLQPPEDSNQELYCSSNDDSDTFACSYVLHTSG